MKNAFIFLISICAIVLAACGYDKEATISHTTKITNLTTEAYEKIGSVQNREKPPIDTLKKVTVTLDVKNYEDLDRPEILVDDNARTLFGNDYWYGSYVLDEGHYKYDLIVSTETLTEAQIKEKLKDMHYQVIWYADDEKQKQSGNFNE